MALQPLPISLNTGGTLGARQTQLQLLALGKRAPHVQPGASVQNWLPLPAVNSALGHGRERADTPVAGQAGDVQEVRWHTGRPGLSWLAAVFLRGRQAPVLGVALGT